MSSSRPGKRESAESIWIRVRAMLDGLAGTPAGSELAFDDDAQSAPEPVPDARLRLDPRLEHVFAEGWERCAAFQVSLTVVAFGIDRFEDLHAAIGPDKVDRYLDHIEKTINATLPRDVGLCAPNGRGGFALVLPDHPLLMARSTTKTVVAAVRTLGLTNRASHAGMVTLGAGIACTNPAGAVDRAVIEAAAAALASAHRQGLGRTEIADMRRHRRRRAA
jgi:diguanylate cyclase (GGDEF)-like protein